MGDVRSFLSSPSARQWELLGARRRAGVVAPLFSITSKKSIGVGEFRDLTLLADWCRSTGHTIIQLLPLNDTGNDFRPYDAQSSIALEPMHISLEEVVFVPKTFAKEFAALKKKYPLDSFWFDPAVKKDKTALLWKMFRKRRGGEKEFAHFCSEQKVWLDDYALFKVLKEKSSLASWESWPAPLRDRDAAALKKFREENKEALNFHAWVQWQLFRQFSAAAREVRKKGIFLMGDLPFLVSRDSADVWANPQLFKLDLSSGAPPDLYFANGQEWGMPPYNWQVMEASGYDHWKARLKVAESFYQLFRVDHFVGLFRVWTFPREGEDRKGAFDPPDENGWEAHGEKIVSMILSSTSMLPCAEDLGTVPDCSFRLLERTGIPGMNIQRWTRDWKGDGNFLTPAQYRLNSIVTLSTHDMAPFASWWEKEVRLEEKEMFWRNLGLSGPIEDQCTKKFALRALEAAAEANSIFSIQPLQDILFLAGAREEYGSDLRINEPGTVHEMNWRLRLPIYLEELKRLPANRHLAGMNKRAGRS